MVSYSGPAGPPSPSRPLSRRAASQRRNSPHRARTPRTGTLLTSSPPLSSLDQRVGGVLLRAVSRVLRQDLVVDGGDDRWKPPRSFASWQSGFACARNLPVEGRGGPAAAVKVGVFSRWRVFRRCGFLPTDRLPGLRACRVADARAREHALLQVHRSCGVRNQAYRAALDSGLLTAIGRWRFLSARGDEHLRAQRVTASSRPTHSCLGQGS